MSPWYAFTRAPFFSLFPFFALCALSETPSSSNDENEGRVDASGGRFRASFFLGSSLENALKNDCDVKREFCGECARARVSRRFLDAIESEETAVSNGTREKGPDARVGGTDGWSRELF